jgi:hypothetical protein
MKQVNIKNKAGVITHSAMMEDPEKWIQEQVTTRTWGKPVRWVKEKISKAPNPGYDYPDEVYAEEDVLERKSETPPFGKAVRYVKLPATYTIEIVDLSNDPTFLLQQCHSKRRKEYPPLSEFADAFVKLQSGNTEAMTAYVEKCNAVKAKHPKP